MAGDLLRPVNVVSNGESSTSNFCTDLSIIYVIPVVQVFQESKLANHEIGAGVAMQGPPVFSIGGARALVITSRPMYGRRELKLVDTPALKQAPPTPTPAGKIKAQHSKTAVISDGDQDVEKVVGWDESSNAM